MGLLSFIFGSKSVDSPFPPLLKAIVIFDEDKNVSVTIEKLHPDAPTYEYVKLVLMVYAKMLVNMPPEEPTTPIAAEVLIKAMENIAKTKIDKSSNFLKIAEISNDVRLGTPKGKKYIYMSTLLAPSGLERRIATDLPSDGYQQYSVFQVPVIVSGVVGYLNSEEIKVLQRALKIMSDKYRRGYDYSNMASFHILPNETFLKVVGA